MKTKNKKIICVTPISKIAKMRFSQEMNLLHSCMIEDETETMFYLQSINKQYRFCVEKKGSIHWRIEK